MYQFNNLPRQQLPFYKKDKKWRKRHLDWADKKSFFGDNYVRQNVLHKKINYDLIEGKLHMDDLVAVLNPYDIDASYVPDKIQHYPIMNSKLLVLRGEEFKRRFDYRVIVTDPNSISEKENSRRDELYQTLQEMMMSQSESEEEFNKKLESISDFYSYEWQDFREIRANALLKHYYKEQDLPILFNNGIMDAMIVGEEMYQVDIVSGEPLVTKLDPQKVRVFRNGYSNKIEDADMIVIEDFWSPGKIIDYFYDQLTEEDMKYIENIPFAPQEGSDGIEGIDDRAGSGFAPDLCDLPYGQGIVPDSMAFFGSTQANRFMYYDLAGNIKVLRVYWKTRRMVKMVTSYDEKGEEVIDFYNEDYRISEELGEKETILWINEAWGGTKIGKDVYVDMGPRPIQYNRISNPSRCHFGIIGSLYNINSYKPFSMVDMMKPYNYLYDVVHDRLLKAIADNWGSIYELDLAGVPAEWDIDKWMYFAKVNHIAIKNSFNEGSKGAATGKLAGNFAGNSRGIINTDTGNYIQQLINILEYTSTKMSEIVGISKQREGQIDNRETVGGVERATLQSSHITEWLFSQHDNVKRRVLECLLETARICLKGRSKKFQYILSDKSLAVAEIDGDEFAESDYGLVVDSSASTQELVQKLGMLAQAALQNQALDFSAIMKIYTSDSISEIQRTIEKNERAMQERQQQAQEQNMMIQQQQIEAGERLKEAELSQKDELNMRDNETKILIAQMSKEDVQPSESSGEIMEKVRQFNEKMKLDRERLALERKKHEDDVTLRRREINKSEKSDK